MNNYRVEIVKTTKTGCCLVFSKYFETDANIKDNTYWRGNKCITVQKIDADAIENTGRKGSKKSNL